MHRYTQDTEHLAQRITAPRARPHAHGCAARRPAHAGRARRPGQASRSPPRASAATRRCASGRTCWRRPPCRSTTRATCRSSRARRPRPRRCSTSSSAPRRSTAARGWRAPARSTPRTRRCAGSPTSPACPPAPAACFVPGGTIGNLSALVAARHAARAGAAAATARAAGGSALTAETHSSVVYALRAVMDADVLRRARRRARPADRRRAARGARRGTAPTACFAVVATAARPTSASSTTSPAIAEVCRERGLWMHVDGAYGGAGAGGAVGARTCSPASSTPTRFIVDPHKWLFAPFDCCALLYRDPELARAAHTQHAGYLDAITEASEWNPSDYAVHLTRRARGLPFWFSLAVHGTDAYRDAIEQTLAVARRGRRRDPPPPLPRAAGASPSCPCWSSAASAGRPADYAAWSSAAAGRGLRVRHADHPPRRAVHPVRDRQPADDGLGHRGHPGDDGVAVRLDPPNHADTLPPWHIPSRSRPRACW